MEKGALDTIVKGDNQGTFVAVEMHLLFFETYKSYL